MNTKNNENQNSQNPYDAYTDKDLMAMVEELEELNREACKEAGVKIANKHLDFFMQIVSDVEVDSYELLLSSNISGLTNVTDEVKTQINSLKDNFRTIISAVAIRIENTKSKTAEEAIAMMQNSQGMLMTNKKMINQLTNADKTFRISCQSLRVTADFFARLNDHILQELENCNDKEREFRLVLGNAVLIYELSNFVIEYLQDFRIEGISEIEAIKKDIDTRIQRIEADIKDLKNKAQRSEIDPGLRQRTLSDATDRENAIKITIQAWDDYLKEVQSFTEEMTNFMDQWVPNLDLIRDNAKNQLNVLQLVAMVSILKKDLFQFKTALVKLEEMKLVSLSPDRVRRLIGI